MTTSEIISLSLAELSQAICEGKIRSEDAVRAHIERINAVDREVNAVVSRTFDEAIERSKAADRDLAAGKPWGPLHGTPITVKDCFHQAGTKSTIGISDAESTRAANDGVLVGRLLDAGAIILGKTNIPQLMIWHECDNPVFGRTNNPWDLERTPGGSSGGEAAAVSANGSPMGLSSDLGGSIRVPAHFCGLCGFKPTSGRLTRHGSTGNMRGMQVIVGQAGPIARTVEDLELAMQCLVPPTDQAESDELPVPLESTATVDITKLRIAMWEDDGFFPTCTSDPSSSQRSGGSIAQGWGDSGHLAATPGL